MKLSLHKFCFVFSLLFLLFYTSGAQTFNFQSGIIPPGGQTCFPANVSVNSPFGSGLVNPFAWPPQAGLVILDVCFSIQTSHPWTLEITLVSPAGTILTLSSFNGAGGVNYTGTCFNQFNTNPITAASAPFTGTFEPQSPVQGFRIFDNQGANGTWYLCITDTLTDTTSFPIGPPGMGATSSVGGGTIGFGMQCPPCPAPLWTNLTPEICPGETVNLDSLFAAPPSWTVTITDDLGNPVFPSNAVGVPGIYHIYGQDPCDMFCNDYATATITMLPAGNIGPDLISDICSNSSVDLNSLFTPSLIAPEWNQNGIPLIPPLATVAGTYQVIAADAVTGCLDTAEVVISSLPAPNLGPDQTIIGCTVGAYNLTLLYNTTGLTATWYRNSIQVSNPAAVLTNGIYMLVATNPSGCSDTALVSLNMSIGPSLGADQNVNVCSGSSVNLTTLYSTGSNTVNWTNNGNPVANPSAVTVPGLYTLIVSNANGCTDTAIVTVNMFNPPVLGPDLVIDLCSNLSLNLTSLYTTTGLTTGWTYNSASVPDPTAVTSAGIYTLLVTDINGCTNQATVTLNSLGAPNLGPDQNTAFCPGSTVDLTVLYSTSGFTPQWTLGGAAVSNPSAINTAGTYQLIVTGTNSCSDTAITIVTAASIPVPGPDQQITACTGETVNLTTIFNTAGNTTSWTLNSLPVTNPSAVTTAGTYQLVCTNAAGCSATANVNLSMNPSPVLGNDQSMAVCSGTTVNLTNLFPLTGLTSQWSVNGNAVPDPATITTSGNYQLIATNSNNCSDTALVLLTVNAGPSLGADQSYDLCPWMTVDLNPLYNVNGLTFNWTLNGQSIQNVSAIYDPGQYQLSVTDPNGCTDLAIVSVINIDCECDADFSHIGRCLEDPVTFTVIADSAILGVHWTFQNSSIPDAYSLQPTVIFPTTESILVTLEAILSCGTKIVEKSVKMENCEDSCRVYIPSAFTPNNDGKNEGFKSVTECTPLAYEMEIWNRFGQIVFKSEDYGHAWDGKNYPEGVYVYHVNYQMPYQTKKTVTGRVTVLR